VRVELWFAIADAVSRWPPFLAVGGDSRSPESVIANLFLDTGNATAATDHGTSVDA